MKEGAAKVKFATLHHPGDARRFNHPDTPSVAGFDQRSRTAANVNCAVASFSSDALSRLLRSRLIVKQIATAKQRV